MNLLNEITNPNGLLEFMCNNIKYGYINNDNKLYTDVNSKEFSDNWCDCIVQDYEGVLKIGVGTCWDQVELERYWFYKNNYKFKTYFVCYDIIEEHSSHTFLVYEENNKYYWFEFAFSMYQGIHKYDNIDLLLKDVISKSIKYNKEYLKIKDKLEDKVVLYEYPKPKKNCSVDEFYNNIKNDGRLLDI